MSSNLPRLLVLTSSDFNLHTSGGIALTRFFGDWPKKRLASVCRDAANPDNYRQPNVYLLNREVGLIEPFASARRILSLLRANPAAEGEAVADSHPVAVASSLAERALAYLGGEALYSRGKLSPELMAWLDRFGPEVLFTDASDLSFIRLANQILDRYRIPLVVETYDDWPSGRYSGGLLSGHFDRDLKRGYVRLFNRASRRFVVGDAMKRAYERRYGMPFGILATPVEMGDHKPETASQNQGEAFTIVYAGAVYDHSQRESLVDVVRAVQDLADGGLPMRFRILTPERFVGTIQGDVASFGCVKVEVSPASDAIYSALSSADLLVIPVNFDRESYRTVRYSVPGKVALYLSSGCPVLVYGPSWAPIVDYVRSRRCAAVVDRRDGLAETISDLASDESKREHLAARGLEVARREHDADVVRRRLQRMFRDVLAPTDPSFAEGRG
ncbi:TPA: hypothetical protein DCE37_13550 [Candidatus Latescibacteria bacterium]|nr:hypothetical protein [Candidatus Latescibacterota bacterium]